MAEQIERDAPEDEDEFLTELAAALREANRRKSKADRWDVQDKAVTEADTKAGLNAD